MSLSSTVLQRPMQQLKPLSEGFITATDWKNIEGQCMIIKGCILRLKARRYCHLAATARKKNRFSVCPRKCSLGSFAMEGHDWGRTWSFSGRWLAYSCTDCSSRGCKGQKVAGGAVPHTPVLPHRNQTPAPERILHMEISMKMSSCDKLKPFYNEIWVTAIMSVWRALLCPLVKSRLIM